MKILYLTISKAISDINNRGIYPDLLRKFAEEGHEVYVICPIERGGNRKSFYKKIGNIHIIGVLSLKIVKANLIEKTLATLSINAIYYRAIKQFCSSVQFDLILYATPPITFNRLIRRLKRKSNAATYLMLKDIFPQNAVDLKMLSKKSPFYSYFRRLEKELYQISDFIGCMSPANKEYVLKHNPYLPKEKLSICPNAIELKKSSSSPTNSEIRQKYGIPNTTTLCIYGGNLGRPQGINFLLEVLESNKNRQDVFFAIVGTGTEFQKLNRWFIQQQPSNMVLLSALERTEYDLLESVSDIGMVFLDYRFSIPNFPSRILSYMENKLPLLLATDKSSDLGRIAEENNFGLWCESTEVIPFNENLNTLLKSEEFRNQIGINGYQYMLKNYTVSAAYHAITDNLKPISHGL